MNAPLRKRYPGTRPFEDRPDDRRLFTGRDSEIEELCQRVASHRVLVLYAASGTGKTSLLRAGVFPKLRERGYLPLSVRFSGSEEKSLLQQLTEEVACDAVRPGQEAEIVDQPET